MWHEWETKRNTYMILVGKHNGKLKLGEYIERGYTTLQDAVFRSCRGEKMKEYIPSQQIEITHFYKTNVYTYHLNHDYRCDANLRS